MATAKTEYDREEVFQWIMKKDWANLTKFLHAHAQQVDKDEILKTAIATFIKQFIVELKAGKIGPDSTDNIGQLFILHRTKLFRIPDEDFGVLAVELVQRNKDNVEQALMYARSFPSHEVCAETIRRYEERLPKRVSHSQGNILQVTENRNIAVAAFTKPLFNSQQEKEFFQALRQVFPRYDVYPNVALSCLINFEAIKSNLSAEERSFFFSGIVDCVVFDQHRDHTPVYFFELDSVYHDTPEQRGKDQYKDNILSAAGQKLYRIRKVLNQVGEKELIVMIREVLDGSKAPDTE
jgi:hypothetical protein